MDSVTRTSIKERLITGTKIPALVGAGLAIVIAPSLAAADPALPQVVQQRLAADSKVSIKPNPVALRRQAASGPTVQLAACGLCGAKKSACGPCGAKKSACAPCGPCGAGAGPVSKVCVISRLAAANPCAAKSCGPAKKAGCGPCGAKKACGPCAPKKSACGPCGAAAPAVKLTDGEARTVYACLKAELAAAYAKSNHPVAKAYAKWKRYNTVSYTSATHGSRFVNNYGNAKASDYSKYDQVKRMPVGAILAKDSFVVQAGGKVALGPLFLMEKMAKGWNKASGDWRYTMIMADGTITGVTKGKGSANMEFCYGCHMAAAEKDSLMFMPEQYRVKR